MFVLILLDLEVSNPKNRQLCTSFLAYDNESMPIAQFAHLISFSALRKFTDGILGLLSEIKISIVVYLTRLKKIY